LEDLKKTKAQLIAELEELRRKEQDLGQVYKSIREGFALHEIILDKKGKPCDYRFLIVNPAFEQSTGLKADGIIGKTVLEVLPDTEDYWIKTYGEVALTGKTTRFENYSIALDKYFEVIAFSPSRGQFATLFLDITEMKLIEKQLQESEERHRTLFETMAHGVVYQDANGSIIYANTSAERILGLTLDQMQGRTSTDPRWKTIHEDGSDFPGEDHPAMISLKSKKKTHSIMGVYNPTGDSNRWISVHAVPLFRKGEKTPYQVHTTFEDVTEYKQMSLEMERTAYNLRERVKELNCIYEIANLIERKNISVDEIYQGIVELIPPSWQYPENTCARLVIDSQEFKTDNCTDTDWKLTKTITINNKEAGFLEVGYINEKPEDDEGPFLKEERMLFDTIVERLSKIAERKKSEEALKEAEHRYRTVADFTYDWEYWEAPDRSFLYVSPACERISGYTPDEFIKNPELFEKIIIDEDKPIWNNHKTSHRSKTSPSTDIQFQIRKKDGSIVYIEHACQSVVDNEGNFMGMRASNQDITDRKKAENSLLESENKFALAFQSSPYAISISDLLEGSFIEVNNAFCRIVGYDREEIIGKSSFDLNIWVDKKERGRIVKKIRENREVTDQEIRIRKKTGEILDGLMSAHMIMLNNKPSLLSIVNDVTRQKQEEEERRVLDLKLQHAQKLESLGVLAGGIAHDFNNILSAFFGYLSLARLQMEPDHPAFKNVNEAEQSLERARSLSQQLLTFARGGEPVKEETEIGQMLRETAKFNLTGSKTQLKTSIAQNLWKAEVDKGQFNQVISNLVINARQSMPKGGIITITAENVESAPEIPLYTGGNKCIKITIEDEGSGISEENQKKIFDPYFTTKLDGSGLGLATVHSIVYRHDGQILIDSRIGEGTKFTILIPAFVSGRKDADRSRNSKQITQTEDIKKQLRILFMDDEEAIRSAMEGMLQYLGHSVTLADCGEVAVSSYKKALKNDNPFDVIILDLTIPGKRNGKEAAEKILTIEPDARIMVVSGYSNDPIMANYNKYGFKSALTKPFRIQEIKKAIKTALNA